MTITFDEFGLQPTFFSGANPLRNEYAGLGVSFTGPGPDDGGAILDKSGNFGVNPLSGDDFLAFNRVTTGVTMLNGGRPFDPETVTFANPTSAVSIFASAGFFTGVFVMSAFDSSNNLLGMDVKTTAVGQWNQLSFSSSTNINHITLTEVSSARSFVYDNLSTVPEPATMAVLGLGAAALIRRRKRS